MFERPEWDENSTARRADASDSDRRTEATSESVSGQCDHCGERIATDEWHPVATHYADGELEVLTFCGERCRERWEGEREESATE